MAPDRGHASLWGSRFAPAAPASAPWAAATPAACRSSPGRSGSSRRPIIVAGGGQTDFVGRIEGDSFFPNAGIIKTGDGVANLLNANTYFGGTIINAGTLLANNTSGSATGSGRVAMTIS